MKIASEVDGFEKKLVLDNRSGARGSIVGVRNSYNQHSSSETRIM